MSSSKTCQRKRARAPWLSIEKPAGCIVAAAELGPRPAPTPENPRARPPVLPGTFSVLVIGKQ